MKKYSKTPVIVGIDAGTTKLACVAMDLKTSKIVFTRSIPTNAYIPFKEENRKEQDLKKIEKVFDSVISDLFSQKNLEIISIGLTGQMHGIIGMDKNHKAVTNLVTWEDQFCANTKIKGQTILQLISKKASSLKVAGGYGIVTLYKWIYEEKNNKIDKICSLPDYLAMRLTKSKNYYIDPSFAQSFGIYDMSKNDWDKKSLQKLGLKSSVLPEIKSSGTVYGKYNGVPVSVALGDNQASFYGSVSYPEDSMLINIGTSAQICYLMPSAQKKKYLKLADGYDTEVRSFNSSHFLISANLLNGGNTYRLLYDFFAACGKELFGIQEKKKFEQLWENMLYLGLQETENIPEIHPLFNGLRSNPSQKALIKNITRENFTPQHLVSGLLAGMAKHYKNYINSDKKIFIGAGNGIRKNPALTKELEKAFKKKIHLPEIIEEAASGAAKWFAKSLAG